MSGLLPPFADYPLLARRGPQHRKLQCYACGEETWHEVLETDDDKECLKCECGHKSVMLLTESED